MLADSFLPNTFWAEAVSIACYVLNRVLVTKPQNKTPYELITDKIPIISYIRPFGCHVTILNIIDHLDKFEGNSDERFLVGYSLNSKAFKVYNLETKRVEENLHINFLENKPNVAGKGPNWLFDLDYLTDSMNYQPVRSENQANKTTGPEKANHSAGTQDNIDAGNSEMEADPAQDYFVLPICSSYTSTVKSSEAKNEGEKPNKDTGLKTNEEPVDQEDQAFLEELERLKRQEKEANDAAEALRKEFAQEAEDLLLQAGAARATSTNTVNTVRTPVSTASSSGGPSYPDLTNYADQDDSQIPALEDIYDNPNDGIFTNASYDDEGAVTDLTNLESTVNVWILVDLRYGKKSIGTKWVYRNKKDERGVMVRNKASLSNGCKECLLVWKIDEEVYVSQPPGFVDPKFPKKVYKVVKALYGLHQAPRPWSWCDEFEALMKSIFQMSSIGELTFFLRLQVKQKEDGIFISQDKYVAEILKKFDFASVKTASTPIETQKSLTKDEEAADVDVHLYRSMIGSLMYLTASRSDIMFSVYACSRFQVTPKTSHLNAVKRIFRYLKGKPKLGLWYPRVSSFDLEAYSDSDYAGANLDRKFITGGCQFLGRRLISWQCKKQTIMATSTTKAEYVAAANCYGQVLWIQNQMLDYGFNFMNTKIYIDNESTIYIVKNPLFHSKTKHIEIRHHFIRDAYEKKLIQVVKIHTDDNVANLLTKAFDASSKGLASPKQMALALAILEQTATGKEISNPFMAGSLPKTTWPTSWYCCVAELLRFSLDLSRLATTLNRLERSIHWDPQEEPVFEVADSDMPQDQEGNLGDNEDEPRNETAFRRDWFKKPTPPQEPTDPDWNVGKTTQEGPTQNWLMTLAASTSTDKSSKDFDELMSIPIDFSSYILNGLKIENLTQEILLGPAFRLLNGTCSNYAELDNDFEECYKALPEKFDWENPEGGDYPFDLSKPLPLIKRGKRQRVPFEFFINNDLKYLQGGILTMTYTTSTTKKKAAKYDLPGIEDMVPNIWSLVKVAYDKYALWGITHWREQRKSFYAFAKGMQSRGDIYSTKRILAVTHVLAIRKLGYGYLEEIVVRRADNVLYRFKEGDFTRLRINDIEDMLLLVVQNRLSNLSGDDVADFAIALRMFTRNLRKRNPYTPYKDPQGFIYVDDFGRNMLMRSDELYKFSDGTLTRLLSSLEDVTKNIDMTYLPKRKWSKLEKKRAHFMIKDINKLLKERRMMRSLKKFVGGRLYETDLILLQRTI
ncbi:putative ribonuclease H-like domain-containing protein [Tanacetum coccineum]